MQAFGPDFARRVEEKVAAVEARSKAEVVVAVAPRSGSYDDVDLRWGALFGFLALALILYSPWEIPPHLVPLDVLVLGGLGWLASRRFPVLRRAWTSARRRRRQVEEAARSAFVTEGVTASRERTGLLLYVSLFEGQAVVLPDLGLVGHVPGAVWNELRHDLDRAPTLPSLEKALLAGLDRLAEMLPIYLPAGESNPDEIPNQMRLLP
jgi:putative membrane protein